MLSVAVLMTSLATQLTSAQDQVFLVTSKNKQYVFTRDANGKGIVQGHRRDDGRWEQLWTISRWYGTPVILSNDGRYLVFVNETVNCDPSCRNKPLIEFHSVDGHIDTIYVQKLISEKWFKGVQGERKFISKIHSYVLQNKTYLEVTTVDKRSHTFDITTGNRR